MEWIISTLIAFGIVIVFLLITYLIGIIYTSYKCGEKWANIIVTFISALLFMLLLWAWIWLIHMLIYE